MRTKTLSPCKPARVLLNLDAETIATTDVLARLKGIRDELSKLAGVLDTLTETRLKRNARYWKLLLQGWGDRLKTHRNELTLAHSILARKLSE